VHYEFIKWVLFLSMGISLPLFYYIFAVGGFVPLAGIALLTFRSGIFPVAGFFGLIVVIVVNGTHLVAYGFLLHFLSRVLARRLSGLRDEYRLWATVALVVLFLLVGFLPVFGIAHHNGDPMSAYALYGSGLFR
jgi:hypothetical protein